MADRLTEWLTKSEKNRRLFAQENLIVEVSEAIWTALENNTRTKADLAKVLGTSKANITQLLNGGRNMTLRTLADIAFALGLEAKVELCGSDIGAWWDVDIHALAGVHRQPLRVPVTAANEGEWSSLQVVSEAEVASESEAA